MGGDSAHPSDLAVLRSAHASESALLFLLHSAPVAQTVLAQVENFV